MEWEEVKLNDISSLIKRGVTPKYVENDGFLVFNQKCIRDNRLSIEPARLTSSNRKINESKLITNDDILINSTGKGTLGRSCIVKNLHEKATVDTHVTIVRLKEGKSAPNFIAYQLNLKENEIESLGKGATNQTELSAKDLERINIKFPPLPTQQKIASILGAYDDLIENNLKRIRLLEEAAQNLYKEWFVNFRFPGHEQAVFDEETGLPEGWILGTVKDLVNVKSGYAYKSNNWKEKGLPVVKIKTIQNNTLNLNDCGFIDNEIALKTEKYELNEGEIVIAMTGATVGKIGLVPKSKTKIFLNQRVGVLKPQPDLNNLPLMFCFFNSIEGQKQVLNYAQGAAQANISTKQIENLKVVTPDSFNLKSFNNSVNRFLKQISVLIFKNQQLQEARDFLLPRLMNQDLDV